jgi:hypothetical protein
MLATAALHRHSILAHPANYNRCLRTANPGFRFGHMGRGLLEEQNSILSVEKTESLVEQYAVDMVQPETRRNHWTRLCSSQSISATKVSELNLGLVSQVTIGE